MNPSGKHPTERIAHKQVWNDSITYLINFVLMIFTKNSKICNMSDHGKLIVHKFGNVNSEATVWNNSELTSIRYQIF